MALDIYVKYNFKIIIGFFILLYAIITLLFFNFYKELAIKDTKQEAISILNTMKSIRNYVDEIQRPVFNNLKNDPMEEYVFDSRVLSASAITQYIYDQQVAKKDLNYEYKLVATNPLNSFHKANAFEADILNRFRREEIQDYFSMIEENNHSYFFIAMPIEKNKITALIGPSGCGKSTLLRAMNRIHDLYPGNLYDGEIELLNSETKSMENILNIKKENEFIELRQKVGMIFQKPTPFPMSIFDNVAYGLKIAGIKDKSELAEKVETALKGSALWGEVKDRLNESAMGLSGGQQQRLCIARAVAVKPDLLLFDEPTSALDPISTGAIEELLVELKKDISIAIVTHNMQQASRISDYTAFMYLGDLVEFDKTETIFLNPSQKQTEDYITGRFG